MREGIGEVVGRLGGIDYGAEEDRAEGVEGVLRERGLLRWGGNWGVMMGGRREEASLKGVRRVVRDNRG